MSTELVPAPQSAETGMAVYSGANAGFESVVRLKPSALLLVQNTTRDPKGARPGQLLDLKTERAYDSLTVVPLDITRQRVLFPPGGDLGAEPICRSNNGNVPSQFAKAPQSRQCQFCPHAKWGKDGQKPACAEKLRLMCVVKDTGLPRFITVGGRSIKALSLALETIGEEIFFLKTRKENPIQLNYFDYYFTLKGEREQNKKGSYYILRADEIKRVANQSEFGPLYEQFVVQAGRSYVDEEDDAAPAQAEKKVDEAVGEVIEAEIVSEV